MYSPYASALEQAFTALSLDFPGVYLCLCLCLCLCFCPCLCLDLCLHLYVDLCLDLCLGLCRCLCLCLCLCLCTFLCFDLCLRLYVDLCLDFCFDLCLSLCCACSTLEPLHLLYIICRKVLNENEKIQTQRMIANARVHICTSYTRQRSRAYMHTCIYAHTCIHTEERHTYTHRWICMYAHHRLLSLPPV